MHETDTFPNYVCADCWEKIEEFHKFHRSVQRAQANYVKEFVKCENVEPDVHDEPVPTDCSSAEELICTEMMSISEPSEEQPKNDVNKFEEIEFDDEFFIKSDEAQKSDSDSDDDGSGRNQFS